MSAVGLSFPRTRRLTRRTEFEQVKKNGRTQRGSLLNLTALRVAKVAGFRAGFVTSRRVGSAVVRNRVRRRLREIARKHQKEIIGGVWIVTVARPGSATATYRQMEDEWLRLATRASILAP
jgi:ribonuclease P protein component